MINHASRLSGVILTPERSPVSLDPTPPSGGNSPALAQHVHGKPLVYLDNAASTQKPRG